VCSLVRAKFVGHELPRLLTLMFQYFTKEAFSGSTVSALRYQNIDDQNIDDVPILSMANYKKMDYTEDGF
jgi:hypothetical protein